MKYFGIVPKYKYANGPVVSWQDMDKAAESQSHFNGLTMIFPSSGQNPFIHGYITAIPAIAAYESWKPMPRADIGDMASWIISAAKRI